jgi:hypothetical protein
MKIEKSCILIIIFSIFIGLQLHGEVTRGVVVASVASLASIGAGWYLHCKENELRDKRGAEELDLFENDKSEKEDLDLKIKACKWGKWAAGVLGTSCGGYAIIKGLKRRAEPKVRIEEKLVKKVNIVESPSLVFKEKMVLLGDGGYGGSFRLFCAEVKNGAIGIVKYVDSKDKKNSFTRVVVFNKTKNENNILLNCNGSRSEFYLKGKKDLKMFDELLKKFFNGSVNCKTVFTKKKIEDVLGKDGYTDTSYNWNDFFDKILKKTLGEGVGKLPENVKRFVVDLFLTIQGGDSYSYKSAPEME